MIFGPAFLPAAPLLALLNFGSMILVIVSVATSILISINKPTWAFALTGPLPLLAILGHLVLIPRLGALGASLVTALVASLGAGVSLFIVYRIWQILPPAGTLWRSVLVCGFAYALSVLWPVPNLLLLIKLLIIGFLIPLAFFVLGEFNAGEMARIRSFLYRRILLGQPSTRT